MISIIIVLNKEHIFRLDKKSTVNLGRLIKQIILN